MMGYEFSPPPITDLLVWVVEAGIVVFVGLCIGMWFTFDLRRQRERDARKLEEAGRTCLCCGRAKVSQYMPVTIPDDDKLRFTIGDDRDRGWLLCGPCRLVTDRDLMGFQQTENTRLWRLFTESAQRLKQLDDGVLTRCALVPPPMPTAESLRPPPVPSDLSTLAEFGDPTK
jgi:hypothetical protein